MTKFKAKLTKRWKKYTFLWDCILRNNIIIFFLFNLWIVFVLVACRHLGKTYKPGATFQQGDSCNTCTCMQTGEIQCTKNKCFPGKHFIQSKILSKIDRWIDCLMHWLFVEINDGLNIRNSTSFKHFFSDF